MNRPSLAAAYSLLPWPSPAAQAQARTSAGPRLRVRNAWSTANGEEPSSLDPAQSMGGGGDNVIAALLDSLIALDPLTLEPAAGLATHYEVDSSGTRYTLFLRGHAKPRGIRLRNTDSLSSEILQRA